MSYFLSILCFFLKFIAFFNSIDGALLKTQLMISYCFSSDTSRPGTRSVQVLFCWCCPRYHGNPAIFSEYQHSAVRTLWHERVYRTNDSVHPWSLYLRQLWRCYGRVRNENCQWRRGWERRGNVKTRMAWLFESWLRQLTLSDNLIIISVSSLTFFRFFYRLLYLMSLTSRVVIISYFCFCWSLESLLLHVILTWNQPKIENHLQ